MSPDRRAAEVDGPLTHKRIPSTIRISIDISDDGLKAVAGKVAAKGFVVGQEAHSLV
jgi:hypothetical protein